MIIKISKILSENLKIKQEYVYLFLITIIMYILLKILKLAISKILNKTKNSSKRKYKIVKQSNILLNSFFLLLLLILWSDYLKSFMTFITFISAGFTIALRDVILNIFAGMYIKINKTFDIEDRICIGDIKGDVVNLKTISFEVLEVETKENGEQSTGIIVNVPNSYVFSYPLKNYNKAFKYIWREMIVQIPLNSDIKNVKGILYKIINENEIIKRIPVKMKNQISTASTEYRVYYNQMKPIIYTKVEKDHIELSIRFLIHPKKIRNVEDDLWSKILLEHQKGTIQLFC